MLMREQHRVQQFAQQRVLLVGTGEWRRNTFSHCSCSLSAYVLQFSLLTKRSCQIYLRVSELSPGDPNRIRCRYHDEHL
ncbi:hypothetical protein L1987_00535 [Smallanthus sonchifolius]|uniref:Uncharacterized protein n=1 Tax=Smallanthus sonchifolius TaxID=185202 RepID=A0ACB9K2K4_9ASTR|nr:hypothetical protein L1987_00535 [Smallanthus sonchifolius]